MKRQGNRAWIKQARVLGQGADRAGADLKTGAGSGAKPVGSAAGERHVNIG